MSVSLDGGAAYVPTCADRIYVNASALPGGDGSSWAQALPNLAEAFAILPWCEDATVEVWVAAGTYLPAAPNAPFNSPLPVRSGMHVYGGFAGNETDLAERDWLANETIISADRLGDDQTPGGSLSDNFHRLFSILVGGPFNRKYAVVDFVLDGMTLSGTWNLGAVYLDGAAEIRNCLFKDNTSTQPGLAGAIYYKDSTVPGVSNKTFTVANCRFMGQPWRRVLGLLIARLSGHEDPGSRLPVSGEHAYQQ